MKLRIQGSSLRLRLNQKEVGQFRHGDHVASCIEFAPGCSLAYLLEGTSDAKSVTATFDGRSIRITAPIRQLTEWAASDQVGIEAKSPTGVDVLIEKDFQCLHRPGQRESSPEKSSKEDTDAFFPNPFNS